MIELPSANMTQTEAREFMVRSKAVQKSKNALRLLNNIKMDIQCAGMKENKSITAPQYVIDAFDTIVNFHKGNIVENS